MTLQKNFLKPSIETLPIPRWQWILNIVVHLGLAYFFYLLLIYIKEAFKLIHFDTLNPLFIEAQYNLMPSSFGFKFSFALFAILFAQTFFLYNIFVRPSFHIWHSKLRARRHKVNIVNNTRFLQYGTLFVLFQLFTFLYIFGYYYWTVFYLQNEFMFNLSFILILIVLYFQQWLVIMRYFKNVKKWQWIVLCFNIGLATIFTFTPQKKVDQYYNQQLNRSFTKNYQIDFVNTENGEKSTRLSLTEEGILAYPKNKKSNKPHLHINNANYKTNSLPLSLNDFSAYIEYSKKQRSQFDRNYISFRFAIGQNVEMKYVYRLQETLREQAPLYINYYVKSDYDNLFIPYYLNIGEKLYLPCQLVHQESDYSKIDQLAYHGDAIKINFGCFMINQFAKTTKQYQNNIHQLKANSNQFFINEEKISLENLKERLQKLLAANEILILEIRIDDNTHFEYYLKTLDVLKSIRNELREQYAQELFQTSFDNLYDSEQMKEINSKSSNKFSYIKFTPKEWKYYDYLKSQ